MTTLFGAWWAWIEDRFALDPIRRGLLERRVPTTGWYHGDGAALLVLLMVQIVTGMFMTPTYAPTPDSAYQSVEYITHEQAMGWFIRGLHYWSAGLLVVLLFVHLFRQILMAGYKSPREGTWLIGVALFCLVMVMAFTGYVLRWDERGLYALRVAIHMFWNVPIVGEHLVVFVQGGYEMGQRTLTRLYSVHVIFVPALLVTLAGAHLYLVVVRGVVSRRERGQPIHSAEQQKELYEQVKRDEKESETFHPWTTARSGLVAFTVLMVAVALTLMWGPRALEPEANLVARSAPAEEWYFHWYSALIALLPWWLAPSFVVAFPIVVFVVLVMLPFVDRSPHRGIRRRPIAVAVVVLCVGGMAYLTDLRLRSPWTGWPLDAPPPVPEMVVLSEEAERGRQLFVTYGCNSCHAVGGHGRKVGPDLARIVPPHSETDLRSWVLDPPADVPMPSYRGRITEQDLEAVVAFVLAAQTFPRELGGEDAGRNGRLGSSERGRE
jgi:ubiquinol-cytochrome c reductase cytochrome b subunit